MLVRSPSLNVTSEFARPVEPIVERLLADARTILDAWPAAALIGGGIAGVVWAAARLFAQKRIASVAARLKQSDHRLAKTKARLAEELKAREDEQQDRQLLEAAVVSLRDQLQAMQRQLTAQRKPVEPLVRKSPRQTRYDDLFGSSPAIEGTLVATEAEQMLAALQEITALVNSAFGSSRLSAADGPAWWRYVASKGIPHAIDLVAAYRNDLIDFANALEAIITRQPRLEFRLRRIIGDLELIAGLLNTTGGYIRSMERLNDGQAYKAVVLEMALGGPFRILVQAQTALHEWMHLFIEQRAPLARQQAASYRVTNSSVATGLP